MSAELSGSLDNALAAQAPEFEDKLIFNLEISTSLSPRPVILSGHNVVRFEVDLRRSGFTGEVCFNVDDRTEMASEERDLLVTMFQSPQLLKIRLGMRPRFADQDLTVPPEPVEVNGIVLERALCDRATRLGSGAVTSYRQYFVRFADPAQALWRQHFPCALYTNTSLQDVIERNRIAQHMTIRYVDPTLAQIEQMIFLGLSSSNRPSERASFYDLLMWRLELSQRTWIYDYKLKTYEIHRIKLPPVPFDICADDLEEILTFYPAVPRHQEALLNDYTEQIQNRIVPPADPLLTQNQVIGVRHDRFHNTPIQAEFEQAFLKRVPLLKVPQPEFLLQYLCFPTKPFPPGVGVDFKADILDYEAEDVAVPQEALRESCRVFRILIAGRTLDTDVRLVYDGLVPAHVACRVTAWLESASNPALRLPDYVLPKYPLYIEGKIVSEIGAPLEETYQFYPDQVNSLPEYKVRIPQWDNQIITLPFNPNMQPGQFYFPAYKHERVLVSMYFDQARIKRFLDWRIMAQLPLESQGDHLLLGKTPLDRTSVRHTYQNLNPVFEIERLHSQGSFDTQLIKLAEGNLLLQVGTPMSTAPPGMPSHGTTTSGTDPAGAGGRNGPRNP